MVCVLRCICKVWLCLICVDLWLVMKIFLLFGVVGVVIFFIVIWIIWGIIGVLGVFDFMNKVVNDFISLLSLMLKFELFDYVNIGCVLGLIVFIGVINVVLFMVILILFSFFYNLVV